MLRLPGVSTPGYSNSIPSGLHRNPQEAAPAQAMHRDDRRQLLNDLLLISTQGISKRLLAAIRPASADCALLDMRDPELARWIGQQVAEASGKPLNSPLTLPLRKDVAASAKAFVENEIEILWSGTERYPARVEAELDKDAPGWLFVRGSRERLTRSQCAVIGSRETPEEYCQAAEQLGEALSDRGIVVTSGMAAGADSAAHAGAARGAAGTIGIPAYGILNPAVGGAVSAYESFTVVGIDRPNERFSAGCAIRRNYVIAALSEALVLVASELRGGSAYALGWALRHRVPVFCFESGR